MNKLRILSGGAAQGLVIGLAAQFENETGFSIAGEFSAVGRMNSRLRNGTPADAVILTSAVIEELTRDGHVLEGSAVALDQALGASKDVSRRQKRNRKVLALYPLPEFKHVFHPFPWNSGLHEGAGPAA